MELIPLKPKIMSKQIINQVNPQLAKHYGIKNPEHVSLGLITCDMDDALYVALDEATKNANIEVIYAKSFYAGSGNSSGPFSGEAIGVFSAKDPSEVAAGMESLQLCLEKSAWFYTFAVEKNSGDKISEKPYPAFFPHVIPSVGSYLAETTGVPVGSALAYLIACPMEASIGLDQALKAARVELVKFYGPPTETNFAGGLLSGEQTECEHAARAFTEAVYQVCNGS